MSLTDRPTRSAVNAYAQTIASGAGHEAALEAVFEEGERAGLRLADSALGWSTSCLGCASRLDKSYVDFTSGERSAFERALEQVNTAPVHARDDPFDVVAMICYRLQRIIDEYQEQPPAPKQEGPPA